VLAITGIATMLSNVTSARADSRICTPEDAGCASFHHVGNTFYVCDEAFDGESVAVESGSHMIIAVNYWGSLKFNGCRTWHVHGHNGDPFKYRVCLARYAAPGGKRLHLEPFYCSHYTSDIY
jgi:hypothetical protein